jgi:hypothetical protein
MHFIRKASLTVIACAMLLVVGTALTQAEVRFIDNGDGTISDTQTGLMWEKKTPNPGGLPNPSHVHDVKNRYDWSDLGSAPNGSAFTKFLYGLNSGKSPDGTSTSGCFAGHCDWRLPLIEELAGIVDTTEGLCGGGRSGACIDPIFGPTLASAYWSATTVARSPGRAWGADFGVGPAVDSGHKKLILYVRAVRSGL